MSPKVSTVMFMIAIEKSDDVFVAYCPGIGGVFEEAGTPDEAVRLAAESAVQTIDARRASGTLPENSELFKIVTTEVIIPEALPKAKKSPEYRQAFYPLPAAAFCP